MPSDKELYRLKAEQNLSYREIADRFKLSRNSVRSRVSREGRRQQVELLKAENAKLRAQLEVVQDHYSLGEPLRLDFENCIIMGDIHFSTTKSSFVYRPLEIAMQHLPHPRRAIIAGDLFNATAFSDYPAVYPEPSFDHELDAAEQWISRYMEVLDELVILPGNHDRRVQKKTNTAISFQRLIRMVSHDPRIRVSHWGHVVLKTNTGLWRVTHGSEFGVNQLTVSDQMALKYQMHIISHHEHHLAMGMDRFKRYIIINNGGLFDQSLMAYTQLDDSKRPNMANGFTMLRDGYPTLFGEEPFTNWKLWLRSA